MPIILGIDPGSRITGFGIIQTQGNQPIHLAHGTIPTGEGDTSEKLLHIFEKLTSIIHEYQPQQAAIEQIFMHVNVQSALKLGQARGTAMVAAAAAGLEIHEYSAKQIKQAAVGYGAADKKQVQHMTKLLLQLKSSPAEDAADALAVALCHANRHAMDLKIQQARMKA